MVSILPLKDFKLFFPGIKFLLSEPGKPIFVRFAEVAVTTAAD